MSQFAPKTEQELSDTVARTKTSFRITGGDTRRISHFSECQILSTANLSGIELYEPGALTLVARAGTPVAEIDAALALEGQMLAFEPMDHRKLLGTDGTPTIGGVVAANVSGPRRISAGACRDHLLGVRFVDGLGRILKNGGRVMKNVTGYDLVKLQAGSWGTLGVLSEVSLKVLPASETVGGVRIFGLDHENAVRAMSKALGSPYEITGAVHISAGSNDQPVTMLRVEGFEASVKYRADQLGRLLAEFGDVAVAADHDQFSIDWRAVRDVEKLGGRKNAIWKLSVKPSDAPALVAKIGADEVIYDWGGGLIWVAVQPGTNVRCFMQSVAGHATMIRGDGHSVFHPQPEALQKLNAGILSKFDPRGLFNPGLMA